MPDTNVLLVGVGGQGTILAGKVLSKAAMLAGLDVKYSEIHGMAQRGGNVVTQVRMGKQVFAPTIEPGEVDFLVAFEQLEALRWAHALRPQGKAVVSTQMIDPMPVLMGAAKYPNGILDTLRARGSLVTVDAPALAHEAGDARSGNVVLLGCLARDMGLERAFWEQAIRETVKPRFVEVNLRALGLGWTAAEEQAAR